MITVWIKTSHFGYTDTLFSYKNVVFSGLAEYSYFSAILALKIFMYFLEL